MLPDIRVVRRPLEGNVQGHFQVDLPGPGHKMPEIFQGAQLRVHRLMPAFGRADGPGRAHVLGFGHRLVILALAVGAADGVDGRQIENIEAHPGDVRQPRLTVFEGAVLSGNGGAGAGKHFIPGAVTRLHRVHHHGQVLVIEGDEALDPGRDP